MGNKIATQLINSVTGERYYIGTVGVVENVAVKLSAPTSEDWASMKVIVQNITQATSNEYALSALGECKFTIPMGNVYSIVYPVLSNYKQPINSTFTATLASRSVEYAYSTEEVLYEQINISAQVVGGNVTELDGMVVSAISNNGNAYAAEFLNGRLTLRIPYGEEYKIILPTLDGYVHDGNNIQMVAGIPSRFILIHYSDGLLGFYGMDDDGNQYTYEEAESMTEEERSRINYIGFGDPAITNSDRGDGTKGNECFFRIPHTNISKQWASGNVEFDKTRLPFNGPTGNAADDMRSAYNTNAIIEIGDEIGQETPAADYCHSQEVTIGGVVKKGNLVAPGIIYRMAFNQTYLNAWGNLLNKTIPVINSGGWWTSCQNKATNAVYLHYGGFDGGNKPASLDVLCCFDR